MLDDWFKQIRLCVSFEQWELLPRFPGYKSEYFDGQAVWSPRPKSYNAVLDLAAELEFGPAPQATTIHSGRHISVRFLQETDWEQLPPVLANAFGRIPPFSTLKDETRLAAASDCLAHTRRGGDGELLIDACVVSEDENGDLAGAILVTRWVPGTRDTAQASDRDAHITWAFVRLHDARHGVGTAMLSRVVHQLRCQKFVRLFTTFMAGNESSMLWHWRSGFSLLPYAGSWREIRKQGQRPCGADKQ